MRRWRRLLANEREEARIYRRLAARRTGEERQILLGLAEAEDRHAVHWERLLGDRAGPPRRGAPRLRAQAALARWLGWVFVLALVQQTESRSRHEMTEVARGIAADDEVHVIVVEGAGKGFCGGYDLSMFGEGEIDHPCQQERHPWDPMDDYAFMKRNTEDFMALWRSPKPTIAKVHGAAVAGALDHWQQVLEQIGFLDPAAPKRLMPRLQQLIQRAQPTAEELHILRGIARAVGKAPKQG